MKRDSVILIIFSLILLFSVVMIIVGNINYSDVKYATERSATSNVSVSQWYSFHLSENLSEGITFGTITDLDLDNHNATNNYDGNDILMETTMWVNVSYDSNADIIICLYANESLSDSTQGNTIGLGNETYSNSTTNDEFNPDLTYEVPLVTTPGVVASTVLQADDLHYYRFWLDTAGSQISPGDYGNMIHFSGRLEGNVC